MDNKIIAFLLFLTISSIDILRADNDKEKDKHKGKHKNATAVVMPEPSTVPETIACLAGIGFLAYRRQRIRQV